MWIEDEDRARAFAAKAGVIALALLVAVAVFVRMNARAKDTPEPPKSAKTAPAPATPVVGMTRQAAPAIAAPPDKLGRALSDNAVRSLIENFRIASSQGDQATARVSLQALKRRPNEAAQILRHEMSHTRDQSLAGFYRYALEELGQ
jgi:hypothetical protein